jgi:hypothetical protein
MGASSRDRVPVMAGEAEREQLEALEGVLAAQDGCGPTVVGADGGSVPVPRALTPLLREIAHILATGGAVEVVSYPRELTLTQAAALLNEPETAVQEMVRDGRLSLAADEPARIRLADVMALSDQWGAERRQALEELIRLNQELGLYTRQ